VAICTLSSAASGHKKADVCCDSLVRVECYGETVGMMRQLMGIVALTELSVATSAAPLNSKKITQDELVRWTQEMNDAVAVGNKEPCRRYYADDAIYFDEKGRKMDKVALLADLTGLPKGYSGSIKIVNPQSLLLGTTAVLTYDMDETEVIFGQSLKARYHETDTWMFRGGRWQIVGAQVLRYYEDPVAGKVNEALLADYVGTYALTAGVQQTVSRKVGKLYAERAGRPKQELLPEVADLFFRPGREGRVLFRRDAQGNVDALVDRRNNQDVVWKRL